MHQPEAIEFRQIRTVPEIVNVTFDFVRQNFKLFWRSLFLIPFPPLLAGLTVFSYFFMSGIDALQQADDIGGAFASIFVGSVLSLFLCAIGLAMLIGVVHFFVRLYLERGPQSFTVKEVWAGVRSLFWRIFGTIVGLQIVYVVVSLLAVFIPFGQFGLMVVITFGALYFPIRIYEGRGFIQSIILSSKLVQGRWWATFGMFWLFILLNFALFGIFILPIILVATLGEMHLVDLTELDNSGSSMQILGALLLSIYMTGISLTYSIPFLSLIFHYYSQRERKGTPALLEEVERIGAQEE